jgi:hypothetical protein
MSSIDQFRRSLDAASLAIVDRLRSLIAGAHPDLTEHIKWNAPSFKLGGEDRITLGLERKGGVRVVLHRGPKPKSVEGFAFADPNGLAKWPAPDRGVLTFATLRAVETCEMELVDLFRRWIAATPD